MSVKPSWGNLPTVVITEIYGHLNKKDRLKASSTCWHWRNVLFQSRFFQYVRFYVSGSEPDRCEFYLNYLASLASHVELYFSSNVATDVKIASQLLQRLCASSCLISLALRPTNPQLSLSSGDESGNIHQYFVRPLIDLMSRRRPRIELLDICGLSQICAHSNSILSTVPRSENVQLLNVATVKKLPFEHLSAIVRPTILLKFSHLKLLSVDYDNLSDKFLRTIDTLPIRKLVFHINNNSKDYDLLGASNDEWDLFTKHHPQLEVHLTLIYVHEAVELLERQILKSNMPLSHLKVLFCESINIDALEYLSTYYSNTLKSVIWIDSLTFRDEVNRNVMALYLRTAQDPLVMISWRCKKLVELVIYGYVIDAYNLVGISRLRGRGLKKLEVSMTDLSPLAEDTSIFSSFIKEISTQMGKSWAPVDLDKIDPALWWTATCSVRDKYILKMVQTSLYQDVW